MTTPIIIDCDPGHDDAIALLMAAASPEIDLLAVTCVAGNATLTHTQVNARTILTVAGIHDIPVAAGLDRPLTRPLVTAANVHGSTGLDGPALPAPTVELDPRHAVDLIVETLAAATHPITLVPTGPLSNIAVALRRAPELREKVARIVLMGGAIAEGNITPSAEFNIYADPEAAHIVFTSGVPLTMIGLDVTHKALVAPADVAAIRALGTAVGTMVAELLDYFTGFHRDLYGWDGAPLHDPCCVAALIRPGLVATRSMSVQIELDGTHTLGRTVCDVWGVTGRPPNVDVGVDIDRQGFIAIMMDCLGRYR